MSKVKQAKFFGVLIAILLIIWAIWPLFNGTTVTNDVIATSIIFLMIAIGYIVVLCVPSWLKAVLFFEGIIIMVVGFIFLTIPYNYIFLIFGLIIVIISILAYRQKLPNSVLKIFYRR